MAQTGSCLIFHRIVLPVCCRSLLGVAESTQHDFARG